MQISDSDQHMQDCLIESVVVLSAVQMKWKVIDTIPVSLSKVAAGHALDPKSGRIAVCRGIAF